VVLHDPTVDRTTNGAGPVQGMTLAVLERLDAGWGFLDADGSRPYAGRGIRVPTLRELLARHPDVPLNIEIKQAEPPIVETVLADLDAHGARERTLLAAEHAPIMGAIRAAAPDVLTGFCTADVADFVFRLRDGRLGDYRPPGVALQVPSEHEGMPIVTADFVAAAHRFDLEVHVWTINDEAEMRRLLALGVDAIMTDFPARAAAVLGRMATS
jgi:glycerophosphoryl diester phosphodiesterase